MLSMVSKELGKAFFNAIISWTWAVEQGEVTLGNCTLRADMDGPITLRQRWCTRAGQRINLTWVAGGLLYSGPCMYELVPKLTLREAVFLMPLLSMG